MRPRKEATLCLVSSPDVIQRVYHFQYNHSLVPRPSITANAVEDLVKLLHRMTSGKRWVDIGRRGTSGEVQSAVR